MDQQLLEHDPRLTARDRYMLTSADVGMTIQEIYSDIPEAEVIAAMWGEHAPQAGRGARDGGWRSQRHGDRGSAW